MITREQLSAVLDHPVYDTDGQKIGDAKHVFFDDATGEPEWVSVKTGMLGTSENFVPIHDASMVEDHLEVPYRKDQVKDAPHVDVDGGGHLSESEEHRLYDYYGIDWDAAWHDANQPGEGGWAHQERADTAGSAGMVAGAGTDAGTRASRDTRTPRADGDGSMTRYEEQMHVGTERRASGRARLRKYVVTEEMEQTVPVRHEEVRVEREPVSEADRETAAAGGTDISEGEYEVTLYEETPVVETKAEPVERVRLVTDERVDEETVHGTVRKERIDADLPDEGDSGGDGTGRRAS